MWIFRKRSRLLATLLLTLCGLLLFLFGMRAVFIWRLAELGGLYRWESWGARLSESVVGPFPDRNYPARIYCDPFAKPGTLKVCRGHDDWLARRALGFFADDIEFLGIEPIEPVDKGLLDDLAVLRRVKSFDYWGDWRLAPANTFLTSTRSLEEIQGRNIGPAVDFPTPFTLPDLHSFFCGGLNTGPEFFRCLKASTRVTEVTVSETQPVELAWVDLEGIKSLEYLRVIVVDPDAPEVEKFRQRYPDVEMRFDKPSPPP